MGGGESELRYFVVLSVFVHVALLSGAWLTITLRGGGARSSTPTGSASIEIEMIRGERPRAEHASVSATTQPSHHRKAAPPSTPAFRLSAPQLTPRGLVRLPSATPDSEGIALPPSEGTGAVCMRNCKPASAIDLTPPAPNGDARDPSPNAPTVLRQSEARGVKMVHYADGGRLFSSTVGPQSNPDFGRLGLSDLADGRVGSRSGREACNPYSEARAGPRTLVILVDTSASVGETSTSCAAGAAVAALDRGYAVEVFNFSTRTMHQPPTRDPKAIYDTLSNIQRRGTMLLDADWLMSARVFARDFALISDTSIQNLLDVLPGYEQALRSNPDNRGLLYLIGDGWSLCKRERCEIQGERGEEWCKRCRETPIDLVDKLKSAGFAVKRIADQEWPPSHR